MIPNLFRKQKIPKNIPEGMENLVSKLNKCKTKEECVKKAYNELNKTHKGSIGGVWKNLPSLFYRNINRVWKRKKLACTSLTYLLRVLLVKSRHFTEDEIQYRTNIIGICPHVSLRVNTGKKWVNIDVYGNAIGVPFGKHVRWKDWLAGVMPIFKKK